MFVTAKRFLYDKCGNARLYYFDSYIFALKGHPVAFVQDEYVYAMCGLNIALFIEGWIRDLVGDALLFSEDASAWGPSKPEHACPSQVGEPMIPSDIPLLKGAVRLPSMRLEWSGLGVSEVFTQKDIPMSPEEYSKFLNGSRFLKIENPITRYYAQKGAKELIY